MTEIKDNTFFQTFLQIIKAYTSIFPPIPNGYASKMIKSINNLQNPDISRQVSKAIKYLEESTAIISQLEFDLKERHENLIKIKKDYEEYKKLAVIEEEKAKTIIDRVDSSINKRSAKERWFTIIINFLIALFFFLMGMLVSYLIKR